MVFAELLLPVGELHSNTGKNFPANLELDAVALAVIEADGLHQGVALERPGEARGGILPAGKENQGGRSAQRAGSDALTSVTIERAGPTRPTNGSFSPDGPRPTVSPSTFNSMPSTL